MKNYIILLVINFMISAISLQAQSYKVIVNTSNTATSITKTDVSNYLLKKRTKWASGSAIAPVDLGAKSTVREAFSKDIHNKTTAQVRAYWQQSVFAGKDTPPTEMDSDAKVVDFVRSNP